MESTNQSFEAFGVLLTKAQELYVRSIKNIVGIALLVYIPMGIITYLVEQYYFSGNFYFTREYIRTMQFLSWSEVIVGTFAFTYVILLVKYAREGTYLSFQELLMLTWSKWGVVIVASILYSIAVGFLCLLLIIPGIIFGVYWCFYANYIVLKGVPMFDAFSASKKLVTGRWWEIFGYCVFAGLGVMIVGFLMGFAPFSGTFLVSLGVTLIIKMATLFMVVLMTLKFFELEKASLPVSADSMPKDSKAVEGSAGTPNTPSQIL